MKRKNSLLSIDTIRCHQQCRMRGVLFVYRIEFKGLRTCQASGGRHRPREGRSLDHERAVQSTTTRAVGPKNTTKGTQFYEYNEDRYSRSNVFGASAYLNIMLLVVDSCQESYCIKSNAKSLYRESMKVMGSCPLCLFSNQLYLSFCVAWPLRLSVLCVCIQPHPIPSIPSFHSRARSNAIGVWRKQASQKHLRIVTPSKPINPSIQPASQPPMPFRTPCRNLGPSSQCVYRLCPSSKERVPAMQQSATTSVSGERRKGNKNSETRQKTSRIPCYDTCAHCLFGKRK